MDQIELYCLSFQNPTRKQRMSDIFKTLGVETISNISEGVPHDDPRLTHSNNRNAWSCMYGHLDMIHRFYYETTKPFGIFCEDDIYIRKDLKEILPSIISDFERTKLDVLLLGYLATFKVETVNDTIPGFDRFDETYPFGFYNYNNPIIDIWGTQMYMLSRYNAKLLLDKYNYESGYAERSLEDETMTHFSADWTITKDGKRAIISPMIAVEMYDKPYNHGPQDNFHKNTRDIHYDPDIHI